MRSRTFYRSILLLMLVSVWLPGLTSAPGSRLVVPVAGASPAQLPPASLVSLAVERTDLRTRYTTVFQRPDGSGYALSYLSPIHYRGPTGAWEVIDNQLITDPTTPGVYQNRANAFSVQVAESTNAVHLNGSATVSTLQFTDGTLRLDVTPHAITASTGQVRNPTITWMWIPHCGLSLLCCPCLPICTPRTRSLFIVISNQPIFVLRPMEMCTSSISASPEYTIHKPEPRRQRRP